MIYDYKGVPLRELKGKAKLQYIWDYYKFAIFAVLLVLVILISVLHRHFTKKDTVLGIALINVIMSEDNISELNQDYLSYRDLDPKKNELAVTGNLAVIRGEGDAGFDYSSEIKLLAMITAKELDVVFLNETAFKVFTDDEYITDSVLLDGTDYAKEVGLEGPVYAAVIGNSERMEEADAFLEYIGKVS